MGSLQASVLCFLVLQVILVDVFASSSWSDAQFNVGKLGRRACPNGKYRCRHNGVCISGNRRCDNFNDCAVYHDDEDNCVCSSNQIQCLNGTCIDRETCRCNGYWECHNGEDELHCSECPSNKFKCTTDGDCIGDTLRCNGINDCRDQSDEIGCPIPQSDYSNEASEMREELKDALREFLSELQSTRVREESYYN